MWYADARARSLDIPGEGVTTDTDGQRLTETDEGGLVDGFVCEAAGQKLSARNGNPIEKHTTHVPDLETTPILPWLKICPGMIPILHPSEIIPGQFPPTIRDLDCDRKACWIMSWSRWGIPSVMVTIRGISASMASRMAAAAPAGGT